jgi:hypothetical protein
VCRVCRNYVIVSTTQTGEFLFGTRDRRGNWAICWGHCLELGGVKSSKELKLMSLRV